MRMLQVEELIRQIEAAEGMPPPDRDDRVRTEIGGILDQLRAALDIPFSGGLQSGSQSSARADFWYH